MNFRNWLVITGALFIAASCDNAGKDKTSETDTMITTVPVPVPVVIEVPEATRTAFQAKYPTATNITWSRYEPVEDFDWNWSGWPMLDSSDYYVRYTMDGNEYWTWYDDAGVWVGTVTTLPNPANLPTAVNNVVNSNFPGYTVVSVKQENDKDRTAYEIKLEKGTDKAKLLVAADGTVLKKVSSVDGEKTKEKI